MRYERRGSLIRANSHEEIESQRGLEDEVIEEAGLNRSLWREENF